MSYLVLARKYRPQTFAEVVGQEHVTRTLANAFAQDRVHHAFLFCGPRGCGKTTTARIVGKALNCEAGPTPEPCGTCQACTTIADGSAVDYFEMDGASNRGIDAIRELTDAVRYQPAMLRKKVYVIDEVHMLTTEAFNALLKTLEEPPPHVTFVLATTEPHKVPTTILSRCQRYDFKLVPSSRLAEHLSGIFSRESIAAEPGAVELVVRESGGSVRDALSLADQIISYVGDASIDESVVAEVLGVADRALTRSIVEALATCDAKSALEAADAAARRGVDEVQLARAVVRYLRDLAVTQVAPDSELLIEAAGARAELSELAARIDRLRIKQMFERMLRACHDLADTQQPRMVLDLALIDVATAEPLVPLGDLLERLGELERRLGSAPRSPSPRGGGGGGSRVSPTEASSAFAATAASLGAPPPRASDAAPAPRAAAPSPRAAAAALATPPPQHVPNVPVEHARQAGAPEIAQPDVAREIAEPVRRERPMPRDRRGDEPPSIAEAAPVRAAQPPAAAPPAAAPPPAPDAPAVAAGSGPVAAPSPPVQQDGRAIAAAPADPLREWDRVINALCDAGQLPLASAYESAKLLSWTEGRIELGVTADGIASDRALSPEKREAMQAFLTQRAGRPMELSVKRLSPAEEAAAKSILEDAAQRAEEERERLRKEAREHPLTRAVLDTFGAAIKEIKTNV